MHSARREHDGHEGMLAACERNAPLNAALFMLLHGEHDKRIRAVLLSLESVLLWLTEVWVGGWGVWVVGWGEASYFVWWVGGWVAAPEGRMVVRWEGGFCVLKKLHADQKWVVRKRTERWPMAPESADSGASVGFYRHRIVASRGDFSILVEIFCARSAQQNCAAQRRQAAPQAPPGGAQRRRRRQAQTRRLRPPLSPLFCTTFHFPRS